MSVQYGELHCHGSLLSGSRCTCEGSVTWTVRVFGFFVIASVISGTSVQTRLRGLRRTRPSRNPRRSDRIHSTRRRLCTFGKHPRRRTPRRTQGRTLRRFPRTLTEPAESGLLLRMNEVDGTHRELRESLGTTNSAAQSLRVSDSHSAVGAHSTADPASCTPHSPGFSTRHSTDHARSSSGGEHRMPFGYPDSALDHLHPADLLNPAYDPRGNRSDARYKSER